MRRQTSPRPWPKWLRALVQSLLVGGFVLLSFFAIYRFHSKLAMASLAASAFIVFGFPTAQSAHARILLGGYACGIVCGGVCCFALHALPAGTQESMPVQIVFCALGVFLTVFAMQMLELQHPPAAALAVSMVLEASPLAMGFSMLLCIAVLAGLRFLLLRVLEKYDLPTA